MVELSPLLLTANVSSVFTICAQLEDAIDPGNSWLINPEVESEQSVLLLSGRERLWASSFDWQL